MSDVDNSDFDNRRVRHARTTFLPRRDNDKALSILTRDERPNFLFARRGPSSLQIELDAVCARLNVNGARCDNDTVRKTVQQSSTLLKKTSLLDDLRHFAISTLSSPLSADFVESVRRRVRRFLDRVDSDDDDNDDDDTQSVATDSALCAELNALQQLFERASFPATQKELASMLPTLKPTDPMYFHSKYAASMGALIMYEALIEPYVRPTPVRDVSAYDGAMVQKNYGTAAFFGTNIPEVAIHLPTRADNNKPTS